MYLPSLNTKSYRDYGGTLEFKLAELDRLYSSRDRFTTCILYEDLIYDAGAVVTAACDIGLPLPSDAPAFLRSSADIVEYANATSEWCRAHYKQGWGLGNARIDRLNALSDPITPSRDSLHLAECLAPELSRFYRNRQ